MYLCRLLISKQQAHSAAVCATGGTRSCAPGRRRQQTDQSQQWAAGGDKPSAATSGSVAVVWRNPRMVLHVNAGKSQADLLVDLLVMYITNS